MRKVSPEESGWTSVRERVEAVRHGASGTRPSGAGQREESPSAEVAAFPNANTGNVRCQVGHVWRNPTWPASTDRDTSDPGPRVWRHQGAGIRRVFPEVAALDSSKRRRDPLIMKTL